MLRWHADRRVANSRKNLNMQPITSNSLRSVLAILSVGLLLPSLGCGRPLEDASEQLLKITADQDPISIQPVSGEEEAKAYLDKTFDDIKFDIEVDGKFEDSLLTDEIRQLDGKKIRIWGYILPTARSTGLKQFVLMRDNKECCFGPGSAIYDCILVDMVPGKSTEFSTRPIAVQGKFTLSTFEGPDGIPLAIYHLKGDSVDR